MDDEHAGHGRAEALPAQLQRLPHARAHHEVDVRRRRLPANLPAHERLLSRQHAAEAAAARRHRDSRRRARRRRQEDRGMARQRQSEPAADVGFPAQDPAAAHRQVHARDHHRIRPAESADPAARRDARSRGQRLVLRLRPDVPRQDGPQDRQGDAISDPGGQDRAGRTARSISNSTRTTIRGSA